MKVDLLKPHTHAGQPYSPGDTLELNDDTAHWLIAQGVAQPSPPAPLPAGEGSKKPNRKE